jgi:hypothetical protein
MNIKEIEASLKGKSYGEIDDMMGEFSTEVLVALLRSSSTKIADTASEILNRRREEDQVAEAMLKGECTTKISKIRAINTISFGGLRSNRGDEALLQMVRDKNVEVAGNALFALVTLGRKGIAERLRQIPVAEALRGKVTLAISALEEENPSVYNPNFRDSGKKKSCNQ